MVLTSWSGPTVTPWDIMSSTQSFHNYCLFYKGLTWVFPLILFFVWKTAFTVAPPNHLNIFVFWHLDVAPQSRYSSVDISYAHPALQYTASFDLHVVRNTFELCSSIYRVVATFFKRKACFFSRKVPGYFIKFYKEINVLNIDIFCQLNWTEHSPYVLIVFFSLWYFFCVQFSWLPYCPTALICSSYERSGMEKEKNHKDTPFFYM